MFCDECNMIPSTFCTKKVWLGKTCRISANQKQRRVSQWLPPKLPIEMYRHEWEVSNLWLGSIRENESKANCKAWWRVGFVFVFPICFAYLHSFANFSYSLERYCYLCFLLFAISLAYQLLLFLFVSFVFLAGTLANIYANFTQFYKIETCICNHLFFPYTPSNVCLLFFLFFVYSVWKPIRTPPGKPPSRLFFFIIILNKLTRTISSPIQNMLKLWDALLLLYKKQTLS